MSIIQQSKYILLTKRPQKVNPVLLPDKITHPEFKNQKQRKRKERLKGCSMSGAKRGLNYLYTILMF